MDAVIIKTIIIMPVAADSSKLSIDGTALGRVVIRSRDVEVTRFESRFIRILLLRADSSKMLMDRAAVGRNGI